MVEKRRFRKYYCRVCGPGTYMEKIDNKIKCPKCRRVVPLDKRGVPLTVSQPILRAVSFRRLRSTDPVRFITREFKMGSVREMDSNTWTVSVKKPGRKIPSFTVGKFPQEPDFDIFHNQESYQIVITLPYHKDVEDIKYEIVDNTLIVESLLEGFDFLRKFPLPRDVIFSSLEASLNNGVLNFHWKKKTKI